MRFLLSLAVLAFCLQTKDVRPEFEVASVKPSVEMAPGLDQLTPGRLHATNLTLRHLILVAFKLRDFQLIGGPGWIAADRFDVEAKSDSPQSADDTLLMLQRLLEDRFRLAYRRETREQAAYVLTAGRTGSRMRPATCTPGAPRLGNPDPCGRIARTLEGQNQLLSMTGVPVSSADGLAYQSLAWQLSISLDRPVIDRTDLTGRFDLTLKWAKDDASTGPSIFTAVQEQLGLRLDPGKGPTEVMIIERAEKPIVRR
jgi:uncharacterized protein (TIGR03435 family)